MYGLLKGLDVQAQVHLVGGDVLRYVGQVSRLNRIQEHQEGENLVVGGSLLRRQLWVVLGVLCQVDFLWNPEVVHGLPIPAGDPLVFHVVEVVEVGGVSSHHPSKPYVNITVGIEKWSSNHLCSWKDSYGMLHIASECQIQVERKEVPHQGSRRETSHRSSSQP